MSLSGLTTRYDAPHRLHLETTKKCNMRCEHCYLSADGNQPHHSTQILLNAITKTAEKGAHRITFTGGEFLMREDWEILIIFAINSGFRNIYFITNGLLLSSKVLSWLSRLQGRHNLRHSLTILSGKEKPLTIGFGISLDGIKGYGLIRRNNAGHPVNVTKVLSRIGEATGYGLYVTVNTTVSNNVIAAELYEMYGVLLSMGIDRWQIDQVFMEGRSGTSESVEPYAKWIDAALDNYLKIIRHHLQTLHEKKRMKLEIVQLFRSGIVESGFGPVINNRVHPCDYQYGSIIVEDGSKVRFCPSLRGYLDDIYDINEGEICSETYLNDSVFTTFARMSIDDLDCKRCRYRYVSHGGCRANCLSSGGSLSSKDPICCKLSPFLEKEVVPLLSPSLQKMFFSLIDAEGEVPE